MSAIDDLTPAPDQPEISEGNQVFHQKAYTLYKWMRERLGPAMVELRDLILNSITGAFSGTSTSTVTITDTGEVAVTTDTGRSFKPGTPVRLASVADPRNYIDGITKTYNETTGAHVFYALAKAGTGTFASWSLTIIPSGGGLAGLGSNTFSGAQYVPDDAYDSTSWNGSTAVPTKNAIRNALVSLVSGLPGVKNSSNDSTFLSTSTNEAASPDWINGKLSGITFDWPGSTAPPGAMALPLVPTNVSRTTYARWFARFGTQFGVGDGSTTFGMPYCPENFAIIQANGNVGSSTSGQMPAHSHSLPNSSTGSFGVFSMMPSIAPSSTTSSGAAGSGSNNLAAGIRMLKCIWL